MVELTQKDKKLLRLAEKGGRDSELFLLEEINKIEDDLDTHKKEMYNEFEELEKKFDNTVKEIEENVPDLDKVLESVRGVEGKPGEKPSKEELIDLIEPLIPEPIKGGIGPKGEKGDKPTAGIDYPIPKDGKDGESIIGPSGPSGKDGSPDTSEQIRDKLEILKGNERLDVSAIKGIEERLNKIEQNFGKIPTRVLGGRQMRIETFAFDGDGATTTFTLPKEPTAKGRSIWIFYQGQWLQRTTHYTIAKRTLTTVGFTAATGTVIEGFLIWQA